MKNTKLTIDQAVRKRKRLLSEFFNKNTTIKEVASERYEQLHYHDRTFEYDRRVNKRKQLAFAAAILSNPWLNISSRLLRIPDGWDEKVWKRMCKKSYPKRLIIAAALLCAEHDRITPN